MFCEPDAPWGPSAFAEEFEAFFLVIRVAMHLVDRESVDLRLVRLMGRVCTRHVGGAWSLKHATHAGSEQLTPEVTVLRMQGVIGR